MKKFKFYAVVFIVLVLSISSLSEIEFSGHHPSRKDRFMSMHGQNLRQIELIIVLIVPPESDIYEEISDWDSLKTEIENKLRDVNLPVLKPGRGVSRRAPLTARLKVNVGYFKPMDSEKYFCRTQIVLSRMVRLALSRNPESFNADVWQSDSLIGMADEPNDIPQKAAEAALKLTNQFISDYKKANAKIKKPGTIKRPVNIETSFVSSKNSKVFHKAGCSAVKMIKAENITNFRTTGDAIRAGFRPCKICGKQKL